jgi:hypothetical protein
MRSKLILAALAAAALALLPAAFAGSGTTFGAPVKVSPPNGHGYEPAVYTDHYGNIFATAHKENWQLAVSPDLNSPTFTRSMSWAWASSDGGHSFGDLPGLTMLSLEQHDLGDEGDMAVDDANHLYFVDTNVTDVTFTRWTIAGLGRYVLDTHRPLLPASEPVDDRPWVTAHGDGHVFYFGNEGDKSFGGRYTVYQSYDGGQTFNSVGLNLPDSGWCRPAADHRAGSQNVYAFCTNDEGKLYAYASSDDGHTFARYDMGTYDASDATTSWPTGEVARDGSLWVLYVDGVGPYDADGIPTANTLQLFHSTDNGKTWTRRDMTPQKGRYEYGWLSVSPDGKRLGFGVYYRPTNSDDWYVYGAVFPAGGKPSLVQLDPVAVQDRACTDANGDLMGSAFNPDGTLSVVWTRNTDPTTCGTVTVRDIYFARSN